MKPQNLQWKDKTEVKKGEIGETIVKQYLEKNGMIVYEPKTDGAHAFDILAIKNKEKVCIVEVKTKPKRKFYNDTGIDITSFKTYEKVSKEHNLKLFIFFVDENEKKIYGNSLNELLKEVEDKKKYPLVENNIIYFHMSNMVTISDLNEKQTEEIKRYSNINEKYISR
jgi:Holliday junction resolvase